MKLAEREAAQATLVRVLRDMYGNDSCKRVAAYMAVSLASLIEGVPQATLARRVKRSRTVIAYLLKVGVLRRDQHGHVRSLDAAFAEIALESSGTSRNLPQRVIEVADWFNELRDPDLVENLRRDAVGHTYELKRLPVSAAAREYRKQAFLDAQAATSS